MDNDWKYSTNSGESFNICLYLYQPGIVVIVAHRRVEKLDDWEWRVDEQGH